MSIQSKTPQYISNQNKATHYSSGQTNPNQNNMMNKLKTLKDIDLGVNDSIGNCICGRQLKEHNWNFDNKKQPCEDSDCEDFLPIKTVLKQEASNWIKDLTEDIEESPPNVDDWTEIDKTKIDGLIATMEWIKKFFNLEEDTK